MDKRVLTVGPAGADRPGYTNVEVQTAVDELAASGGGAVRLLPGRYVMRDSLHLRSGVDVEGEGAVLWKAPSASTETDYYLGYGHYDVTVKNPERFEPGDGILIWDKNAHGFYATQATVTWKRGRELGISKMLNHDISSACGGTAATLFPVVRGEGVKNVHLSGFTVDGNAAQNDYINGCRGGGIFLLGASDIAMEGLTVTETNGDGISFQQCVRVLLDSCRALKNRGHGGHPGSGSVDVAIKNCEFSGNGNDGVFYCLRVTYSVFRNNTLAENGGAGVSIGHRDFHIGLEGCRFYGNGGPGVQYRNDNQPNVTGNYTYIRDCDFRQNCKKSGSAHIEVPPEVTGFEVGNCSFDGGLALRCEKPMTDAYFYDNGAAEARTVSGVSFARPEKLYEVENTIPDEAYAHLKI